MLLEHDGEDRCSHHPHIVLVSSEEVCIEVGEALQYIMLSFYMASSTCLAVRAGLTFVYEMVNPDWNSTVAAKSPASASGHGLYHHAVQAFRCVSTQCTMGLRLASFTSGAHMLS